jgi:hypothetical protein
MYFDGRGVPQVYATAALWFRKAAERGSTAAQMNLGACTPMAGTSRRTYRLLARHLRAEVWLAVIDRCGWIGLNRSMLKQDAAAILGEILSEADALIRLRPKEQGLELPHLVVGATPDNQIVVRSNGDHEVMRSFGEDLKNMADELTAPPEPGDTTH